MEHIICPGLTEKEKKAFLLNNRGRTVFGPYEGILHYKGAIVKDYSKSPDIHSAVALSAHGTEKKVIEPRIKGIEKKYNPVGLAFQKAFGTIDRD